MWFSNKKENKKDLSNLPDLPELPNLPEASQQLTKSVMNSPESFPSLPSFPNSDTANRMSREVIKSSLATEPSKKPYTQEIESPGRERWIEERGGEESSGGEFDVSSLSQLPAARVQEKSPIFVRIDRFQAAAKTLNEIRRQIASIESALSDIRKIKSNEEQELAGWEHEVLDIKAKIDSVDKTLFSKLE